MARLWLVWVLVLSLVLGLVATVEGQDQPEIPNTPDELLPGVPLDGSIIIDESFWLRLVGEPGRLMRSAHERFSADNHALAGALVRDAASFLHIASDNAAELARQPLRDAARELDRLSERLADGSVDSIEVLEATFARAHYAMARHHTLKATEALEDKQHDVAGGYLSSAINHFQRAAKWSNRKLHADNAAAVKSAQSLVGQLIKGKPPTKEASELIMNLRERIKAFGKYIKPAKPAKNTDQSDEEAMP